MTDELTATFAALANPTRRSILAQLAKGEATVNELAASYAMSLPSVSRHLKVLERAGLVSKGRTAQWRPCRLEVARLQAADAWMEPYRTFYESRLDRLEAQLRRMTAGDEPGRPADPPTPSGRSAGKAPTKQKVAKNDEAAAPRAGRRR